jgi:hypothetical protein
VKRYGYFLIYLLCVVSAFQVYVKDMQLDAMRARKPVLHIMRHEPSGSIGVVVDGELRVFPAVCHPNIKT